jgi:hypothetical protein
MTLAYARQLCVKYAVAAGGSPIRPNPDTFGVRP